MRYEIYDTNKEVVDAVNDLQDAQISFEHESAMFILDTKTNKIVYGRDKKAKATNIVWETDGEEIDLPTEIELPYTMDVEDESAIIDYLSDETGWLVISYDIELED